MPEVAPVRGAGADELLPYVEGILMNRGQDLFNFNSNSDAYYVVVYGMITLYDARDKDSDGECGRPLLMGGNIKQTAVYSMAPLSSPPWSSLVRCQEPICIVAVLLQAARA